MSVGLDGALGRQARKSKSANRASFLSRRPVEPDMLRA